METTKIPQLEILELEDDDDEVIITHSCSRKGSRKKSAISVEPYDDDRDIQLALMASLTTMMITSLILMITTMMTICIYLILCLKIHILVKQRNPFQVVRWLKKGGVQIPKPKSRSKEKLKLLSFATFA